MIPKCHSNLFFSYGDLLAVQQHQRAALESEIAAIDGNRLRNTNVEDLVTHIADKYRLEGRAYVTGTEVIVEVHLAGYPSSLVATDRFATFESREHRTHVKRKALIFKSRNDVVN